MTTRIEESGAGNVTFQHAPDGFTLTSGKLSYLISDKDIVLLRRGYTIPLRDQDRKPLGPTGTVYTRKSNTEIRLPSGDIVTIPTRLLKTGDNIRRVILSSSCHEVMA